MMPGTARPADGDDFYAPVTMLTACHGKVRHFAALAGRLVDHVAAHGADAQAREAAASVLRYFDVAAPLHHEDEEIDLFPQLVALDDPDVSAAIVMLEREHIELGELWHRVRIWLLAVEGGGDPDNHESDDLTPPAGAVAEFVRRYPEHADAEERLVYPHAARLSPEVLAAISRAMQRRRGLDSTR